MSSREFASVLQPNGRVHLPGGSVTALARKLMKMIHHLVAPGPRRTSPAGDANVRRCSRYRSVLFHIFIASLLYSQPAMSSPSQRHQDTFVAHMDGSQVVPPTASRGTGAIEFIIPMDVDQDPRWCTFWFLYDSLSSPVTGAYLMTGAAGQNGAILDTLAVGFFADSSGIRVQVPLAQWLLAYDDLLYAVITTTAFPLGEIRGHFVNETLPAVLRSSWGRVRHLYR